MPTVAQRFGARLRQLREERGMSAADLAQHVGSVYPSTIYNVEAGRKLVSFEKLLQIARVLDVDEVDFFYEPHSLRHQLIELTRHAPHEILKEMKASLEAALAEDARASGHHTIHSPRARSNAR